MLHQKKERFARNFPPKEYDEYIKQKNQWFEWRIAHQVQTKQQKKSK